MAKHARGYGIHSTFVYGLIRGVLMESGRNTSYYSWIRTMQKALYGNKKALLTDSRGSGSKSLKVRSKTAGKLAKTSGLPQKYIRLLINLTHYLKVQQVLELGTCCGLTSACIAKGNKNLFVHTIEGNEERYQLALGMFSKWRVENVVAEHDDFARAIARFRQSGERFDMVFIDGDHDFDPTMKYFEQSLKILNSGGIIVVDDIYWSPSMNRAWQAIQAHAATTITIDLYRLGLVFIGRQQAKQHFRVRF